MLTNQLSIFKIYQAMNVLNFFEGIVIKKKEGYIVENLTFPRWTLKSEELAELEECLESNFKNRDIDKLNCGNYSVLVFVKGREKEKIHLVGFLDRDVAKPEVGDALFRLFDEVGNLGIILYSEGGKIVFVNKTLSEITGYDKDELEGRFVCDLVSEPHKDICIHHVKHRLKGVKFNSSYTGVKLSTKDGRFKFFSVFGNSIIFKGNPAGLLFFIDITNEDNIKKIYTALKNIDQLIVKSRTEEELFKSICEILIQIGFKASSVVEVLPDGTTDLKYNAGKGREFFESILNKKTTHNEQSGEISAFLCEDGNIVINTDTESNASLVSLKGELLRYNFHSHCAIPIRKKGKVKYILFIFSEYKNSFVNEYLDFLEEIALNIEFALEKLERDRYLLLIEGVLNKIDEAVFILDSDGRYEFVNDAFLRVFGSKRQEIVGRSVEFIDSNCIENSRHSTCYLETEIETKDNKKRIFDISLVPVENSSLKIVGVMVDITEKKAQQERLEQLSRLYKTLFYINESFVSANSEEDIFKEICKVIVEHLEADLSFIVFKIDDGWKIPYAAGIDEDMRKIIKELVEEFRNMKEDVKFLPFIRAIETKSVKIVNDLFSDKRVEPFRCIIEQYTLKRCFALPIIVNERAIGVIVAVFSGRINFDKEFVSLLNQIKFDLSAAIEMVIERRWNRIINLAVQKGFSYVVVMDKNFRVVYMNDEALKLYGFSKDEVFGKKYPIFSEDLHDKSFIKRFKETLRKGKIFSDIFNIRAKDGRIIYGYTTVIPFKDNNTEFYIAVGKDITKEAYLKKRLAYISNHDPHTGLYNKEMFIKEAGDVLKSATKDEILAVAILDIRNCSYINQVYGYKGGDKLIRETALRLRDFLSESDVVGRFAGDKFAMLLGGYFAEEDVLINLNGLLKMLSKPIKIGDKTINPSFCIGVSFYPTDGSNIEDLLTKAEFALINAKKEGENEIGFYKKQSQQEALKVIELKSKLSEAFKNRELVLFFQPYYDINTLEVAGAESLIRWIHEGNVIPPKDFIEVLENSNLIYDVEEYLLGEAVKTISMLGRKIPISINLSAKSFKRDYLFVMVKQALEKHGVDGKYLTVEIVERIFLDSKSYTKEVMEQLKSLNVRIAVDDFGTGYSSLTYIRELPIDILKIDITFVKGMMENEKDLSLVRLIINVAKEFGFKTVAEGVETKEQLELLRSLGCDYAQGYLFSKPMSREQFLSLLSK